MKGQRNISIIWDFDGTLIPDKDITGNNIDSTSQAITTLSEGDEKEFLKRFWSDVKDLVGNHQNPKIEHILASDAPIWMYSLSRLAQARNIPLNKEFFKRYVVPKIKFYPNVISCLKKIKNITGDKRFKKSDIKIHHFIVSAGLKDLIKEVFPENLITYTFGCRYIVRLTKDKNGNNIYESIPTFCMDETMKTRSIFEIAKGTFRNPEKRVNKRIPSLELWSQYSDMIYIGDGPTDIPALALVRGRGGYGVIIYDKKIKSKEKLKDLSLDERANVIIPPDFSVNGELFKFIQARCYQILQFYEAKDFIK